MVRARNHGTIACVVTLATAFGLGGCSSGSSSESGFPPLAFPTGGPQPAAYTAARAFPAVPLLQPIQATHAGDGSDRVFVVERAGRILGVANDDAVTNADVLLDIRNAVDTESGEMGLLGLAFSPTFTTDRKFFVHYTVGSPRRSRLAEWTVDAGDPTRADPSSERVLLEIEQPFSNHNGGMLAFGPDGILYASIGDGGSGGNPLGTAQDLDSLLGKILRIDPFRTDPGLAYAIPSDNPFASTPGARDEVWAFGLRHPWRFSFDSLTGELWCGDVGQNAREEIDLIVRGGDYGWSVFEGNLAYDNPNNRPASDFLPPIIDYGTSAGRAVIGGYVYRGTRHSSLRGTYVYGDNTSGRVWALVRDGNSVASNVELFRLPSLTSFGEDESGELLFTSLNGAVFRIEAASGGAGEFPTLLSATGIFDDTAMLTPSAGMVEYEVNVPLWSDGARKRRWLFVPRRGTVEFSPSEAWSLPRGSVLVKHFEMEMTVGQTSSTRRLETRVMVHESDGWAGYTYRWNAQQTDAELLETAVDEDLEIFDASAPNGVRTQTWRYPSRADCMQCHTQARERVLGVRTRQLNRIDATGSQQLERLERLGLFTAPLPAGPFDAYPELDDDTAPVGSRARGYLAVNCASCHLPGGTGRGDIDLRFRTPDRDTSTIDLPPLFGDLGLPQARIVSTADTAQSVLLVRMRRTDEHRMPRLGSSRVDAQGVDLVERWIDALPN